MSHDFEPPLPVVIFAGGLGTRLGDSAANMPKPMVKVGPFPILMHVMSMYIRAGHHEFIICSGYLADKIKKYFKDFNLYHGNPSFQFTGNTMTCDFGESFLSPLGINGRDFSVRILDTGEQTFTGGRLAKAKDYINAERFLCTYGDGVSSLNINEVIQFHKKQRLLGTLTAFHPPSRFGEVEIDTSGCVTSFKEKPLSASYVNGGFFVFEKNIFDYLNVDLPLEEGLLSKLASVRKLAAFKSDSFWQMMDTPREVKILNDLYVAGSTPWLAKQ